MKKICTSCNIEKNTTDFRKKKKGKYGVSSKCKVCLSDLYKEYYNNNKKFKINSVKRYYDDNKEKVLSYKKEYYIKNKEYIVKKSTERTTKKRKNEPLFRLLCNLRRRTNYAFKNVNANKTKSTKDLLGCEFDLAKIHIENKFTKGMNWENYGKWHIDHIIPLCSAENESELKKLCHYTNLQPLWAEDNLSKGGKY